MKLPRELSGARVIRALERLAFVKVRQTGSHVQLAKGGRKVTVPNHPAFAPGTLKKHLEAGRSEPGRIDRRFVTAIIVPGNY